MKLRFTILFLISAFALSAQDTSWAIFTTRNSPLPDNNVSDIAFDRNGVAWIATWNGLVRYDGKDWKVFNTSNSTIPTNLLNHLAFDRSGTLWIGTNSDGLVRYDGSKWTQVKLPEPNIVLTVEIDKQGRKWIGTFTDGLYLYDGTKTEKIWGGTNSLDYNVNDILFDQQGSTWFATPLGAFMIPAGGKEPQTPPEFPGHVFDLAMDHSGRIWLTTLPVGKLAWNIGDGWNELDLTTTGAGNTMSSYHLQSVNIFPSGAVLTGTSVVGELARYEDNSWTKILTPFAHEMKEGISSVAIDHLNNIWVGTWGQGLMISSHFMEKEETIAFESIVTKHEFEQREIEEQHTIVCRSPTVEIKLWDQLREDGDSVSLNFNGKWIVRHLALERKGTILTINLKPGEDNYLILHAENLGRVPPNTAAMQVNDGSRVHKINLRSDFKKSGTIRLVYQPE